MLKWLDVIETGPSTGGAVAAEPDPRPAKPAQCLRCAAELSRLPEEARYCRRCGLDTYASAPAILVNAPPHEQLRLARVLSGWAHLADVSQSAANEPPAVMAAESVTTSGILQGYGNALYKLGLRYESGGAAGNHREAIRCYWKSARLGNVLALARLASHWLWCKDSSPRRDQAPPDSPPPTA